MPLRASSAVPEDSSGSTSDAEMKKKKGNRAMGKKKYPKVRMKNGIPCEMNVRIHAPVFLGCNRWGY